MPTMTIGEVVGNKVMVLFHSASGLEKLGIDDDSKYCRVVGFDNIGPAEAEGGRLRF